MVRQLSTAIHVAGREIDLVWEGNSTHTLYAIGEVLHRDGRGDIDWYRRLYAYGWLRSKKDARSVLRDIAASDKIREYEKPHLYRRRKYYVDETGKKARKWGVHPGTVYYFIMEIDNPYWAREHQTHRCYQGPALGGLLPGDFCDYSKVSEIAVKLDDMYWQECKTSLTELVEVVDRRRGNPASEG